MRRRLQAGRRNERARRPLLPRWRTARGRLPAAGATATTVLLALLTAGGPPVPGAPPDAPDTAPSDPGSDARADKPPLVTPAEADGFEATPSYDRTLSYLRVLETHSPRIRLEFFGTSAEGRPMPLVIVSADRAFTPAAALAAGKPIVLIQNGIHAGEIDGKDACLMILREIAAGLHADIVDGTTLLVVPIYNVDGHERVSPHNRPNQNGPVRGMGFRTTANGLDLNRDHLKLQSLEARAMTRLFNRWRPHLQVDDHVTNGSDHDWVLTYAWAETPQLAPSVDGWLREHMPRVLESTRRTGHRIGPYVGLLDRDDPSKGFSSIVAEPRYASGYYPLRHRPSILVENHAYKPYRDRVLANRDFLLALLREVARDRSLIEAVRRAERRTVALGRRGAEPSRVVLRYAPAAEDTVRWPVYEYYRQPSEVLGVPLVRYRRGEVRELEVPWRHRLEPELTVTRPRGYLVLPGWPAIEQRLRGHDLQVLRLSRAARIEVETIRVSAAEYASRPYQGLTRVESVTVERRRELREVPAGALWIPADQPDFEVAVQLLEPEAPDSLLSWGLLSSVLERKEYIAPQVLEDLVREMLKHDPRLASEWERALRDETLSGDPWARWLWWYRRTPHWDERVGMMPVYRVMENTRLETAPW